MLETAVAVPSFADITEGVLERLRPLGLVGIASRDRFVDAPAQFHPARIMPDFQSVIAFAQRMGGDPREHMIDPRALLGTIAAQSAAITFLSELGYRTELIGAKDKRVSLPRLAERAGLGEYSPVNSLVIAGHGLRTILAALITTAPLYASPLVRDVCLQCNACVDVCPAAEEPYRRDPAGCVACGECVEACPV